MKPRVYTAFCLALIYLCTFTASAAEPQPETRNQERGTAAQRPNILFILVDDMGWSDLASYGHKIHETPYTDRLAGEGMRFTNAYAPAPVCGPSRCAILTGKFPSRTGFTDNYYTLNGKRTKQFMKLDEFTLGEAFQTGGYQTAFVGKWHLDQYDSYRLPRNQGFDVNLGSIRKEGRKFLSPYGMADLEDGPEGEYLPDRLTTEAIKILENFSTKEQPWFMYLSFYVVHGPFVAKEEKVEKYRQKYRNVKEKKRSAVEYAAMVESMDENVGRVLEWLDEKELRENTIIVFTSDNGGLHLATSNQPLRSYKGHIYDGGIREPLIIDWPGVTKAGSVSDLPVHGTDFYPTLLEMIGLPLRPEQHLDGVSFVPLLKGVEDFDRGPMVWHDQLPPYRPYSEPGSAIRIGDWKYLHFYEDGRRELYNLKDDIGETVNLVKRSPEKAAEMKTKLDAILKEHGAKIPIRVSTSGK